MQGWKRKVVYVSAYEGFAIVFAALGLAGLSGQGATRSTVLAVMCSAVAVVWNLAFNTAFEAWESRQTQRGRSLARRAAHAIGFEAGLAAILVPLFAWWLQVDLWTALVMDAALLVFFLVYTFGFNWLFDRFFGLPDSATRATVRTA
jgi:uncharacterized membrane protein